MRQSRSPALLSAINPSESPSQKEYRNGAGVYGTGRCSSSTRHSVRLLPFHRKYSSGIIVPTFGDELARGFYLRDGGYYFAINDYIDLALTGEIYTKGSWGINARSAYIKRYKYSGNFDLSFITTITGDKGLPDYSK